MEICEKKENNRCLKKYISIQNEFLKLGFICFNLFLNKFVGLEEKNNKVSYKTYERRIISIFYNGINIMP